jgi:hypothetical protein
MPVHIGVYEYRELKNADIRLVRLFPAQNHHEDISIAIIHEPLSISKDAGSESRMSRKELQKSLPKGWEVFETPEGRYLFCYETDDEDEKSSGSNEVLPVEGSCDENSLYSGASSNDDFITSWDHPDSNLDRAEYELPPNVTIWQRESVFEALSYTWGTQENPGTAFVKQPVSSGKANAGVTTTLPIGRNLESALRSLRNATAPRTLWIDALCINQNDDAEKAVQVTRMSEIYSLATRVVVWLGPEADDSDLAVSTLAYLGAQVETTLDTFRLTAPGAEQPTWYDIDVELPYNERQWEAIDRLVSRPWFSRVWTAQEIQLANRLAVVQVGGATVTWALFRRAVDCLKDKPKHGSKRLRLVNVTSSTMNGKGRPIVDLFRRHAHRECSIAHDKVYGMLALVHPAFLAAIRPDYTKPVAKAYAETFVANTRLMARWDLFGVAVADRTAQLSGAPSWVPDFTTSMRPAYFSGLLQFASGNSQLDYRFGGNAGGGGEFCVRGIRCAVVKRVGRLCPQHERQGLKVIRSWEPGDLHKASYVTNTTAETSLLDAFCITLMQNDLRERNPTDTGWLSLAEWKAYCRRYIFSGSPEPLKRFNSTSYLDDMVLGRCANRVFLETEEKYIGMGPRGCEPGEFQDEQFSVCEY